MDTTELRAQLEDTRRARRGELVPVQRRLVTPSADVLDTDEAYAERLAKSVLLPSHYRRNPANILWAVEFGRMLGIPPMAAMLGVYVVDGSPTARASLIGFLVRRAGHKLRVRGGQSWTEPAFAEIIRHDDPDFAFRSDWTVQRAHESQLVRIERGRPVARDSKGRPMPWERYTPALLKARAITEAARDACQDALFGLQYTPEELGADIDEHGHPTGHLLDIDGAGYHRGAAPTLDEAMEKAQQHARPAPDQEVAAEPEREQIVVTTPASIVDDLDDTEGVAEAVLNSDPIDWDAALAEAAGAGVEALRDLWWVARRAEPDNVDLRRRINAAGAQLADSSEDAASAEPPGAVEPAPGGEAASGE
ncbi:hypothetical protein DL991_41220 [Amycolatopsis sp. WAC 01375]|uniref:hypothetical protein n=1 Tax=Amycolatopsis sp. WAC 01375 TaxID=2203194 RepID=UPI000F7A6765|nr:hypothetical protein [Amycolatopsis sp. WAC 01375]RSM68693.1 hypothetical protein DL991_41220 [Amycolatopsis sp. WAC 01375]